MQPARPLTCAHCGYDLSATPIVGHQITCPECGGHRVRMPAWWEPHAPKRWAALFPALALAAALPPATFVLCIGPDRWGPLPAFLAASPPFAALALVLAAWRPAPAAGLTILATTSLAAAVVAGYGLTFGFVCLPVGVAAGAAYCLLPPLAGLLLARTAFRA